MSNKRWTLFMLALSGSSMLTAQTKNDSTFRQLDQVVVTATRYPVKESQTGKVVIVINHDELAKNTGKTLGLLLNEQAGITVAGSLNSTGTNQGIFVRGAGSGRTLVTIDGVPVGDPSQSDNSFDINLIPVSMIERIEISKGAQSTLYGSDAIAGVINIITVKSDIKSPFNVKASLSGGSYGTYNGSAQLYGKIADHLIYNIRYNGAHTDGYSTAYDSTHKAGFDNDGYRSNTIAANVAWNPVQPLTIRSFIQYSRYANDIDAGAFSDAKNYTNTNKNFMVGGGFTYALANTTLNGNYLYNTAIRNLNEDSSITPFQTYYNDKYYGKSQYAEIFAATNLGYGFTWLNGADYRYASMNETGISGTYPLTFKDTSVSQTSMYSSLSYSGTSGLNVELGGRLNTHSRYGSNYTYTFNPSFLIDRNWKVYASVASGFKAPTLYQLYSSYGNAGLQPETSVNYEGGVQFSDAMFNSRATYFHRKTKDGIDFNYFTYQYFNYNEEKAHGIEWENKIKISRIFSVSANYTWLKIKGQSQSHVTYSDTTYNYALRRPEHTVNLTLGVQPLKSLYVSVGGHYESKRFDIGGYDANFNALPDVTLKGFAIFNAYAEYRPKKAKWLKVFAEEKNITKKKFTTIYGYNSIPSLFNGGATIEF